MEEDVGIRFGWFVGEFALISLKIVYEAIEKVWLIRDSLQMTQSRQKPYGDNGKRDLKF